MKKMMTAVPKELRNRVDARVRADGVNVVAAELGMSRDAVTRVIAGLPVQSGTNALVREWAKKASAPAKGEGDAEA